MNDLRPSEQDAAKALHELFAARVRQVPIVDDLATVAVLRAGRIARRRALAGGLAVTLAFVLVLGTVVSAQGWWLDDQRGVPAHDVAGPGDSQVTFELEASTVASPPGPVPLKVDMRIGNRLWDATADRWRPLITGEAAATVIRTPLGWLVGDEAGLWLMRIDGSTIPLLPGGRQWAVNPDGTQLATVDGSTLLLETLTKDGLREATSATVPGDQAPIGFLSTSVLLATGDHSRFGMWRPGSTYRSAKGFSQVFSSSQAETFGLARSVTTRRLCLVRVTGGTELHTSAVAGCHELLNQGAERAAVSPNGQHLATPFAGGMWIINLSRSVAAYAINPATSPVWVATCASDQSATPVWQDDSTVLTSDRGAIVACGVDGSQRPVELPAGVSAPGSLVPVRR
jgi:hypothetical protein